MRMAKVIYVIGPRDGPQKIGLGKTAQGRLRNLQTGNGSALEIAGSVAADDGEAASIERFAHYLLEPHRMRGEWFDVSPEQAVEAITQAADRVRRGEKIPPKPPTLVEMLPAGPSMGLSPSRTDTAKCLRSARIGAGLRQYELAQALGISAAFLCTIEKGDRPIPRHLLAKLPREIRRPILDLEIAHVQALRDALE